MKNDKKKNAIRFGAIAVAALLFVGIFSAWALSTQATADVTVGDVADDIGIESIDTPGDVTFEDTFAGRPGNIDGGNLFTINFEDDTAESYTAIVYLSETEDLDGIRTFGMEFEDTAGVEFLDGDDTLTLENGRIALEIDPAEDPVEITVDGGFYHAHPFADLPEDIEFMIDIEPVGAPE